MGAAAAAASHAVPMEFAVSVAGKAAAGTALYLPAGSTAHMDVEWLLSRGHCTTALLLDAC